MIKEMWCEVWDQLCEELGKDPTHEEMDEAYADYFSTMIDTVNEDDARE